jgi:uncharacterized protein YkwD
VKAICGQATLVAFFLVISLSSCGGGTGGGAGDATGGTAPQALTQVEDDLLSLINAERTAAGLPALVRADGLDGIELWFVNDMATNRSLSHTDSDGRTANQRAVYYGGDPDVRCSEIIQWWGGPPSGQVHYAGYVASEQHHNAFMEVGIFNLGPTTHCGVAALEGTGPAGTQYEGTAGSYTAVLLCDMELTPLAIDPFSE